jgi:hypothetical protein
MATLQETSNRKLALGAVVMETTKMSGNFSRFPKINKQDFFRTILDMESWPTFF